MCQCQKELVFASVAPAPGLWTYGVAGQQGSELGAQLWSRPGAWDSWPTPCNLHSSAAVGGCAGDVNC